MAEKKQPKAPARYAYDFLATRKPHVYYREDYYEFIPPYERRELDAIRHAVHRYLVSTEGIKAAHPDLISTIVRAIADATFIDGERVPPFNINGAAGVSKLVVANGIVDVDLYVAGQDPLGPHDDNFFTLASAGYDYDPTAKCPRWDEFLLWHHGGDEQTIDFFYEFAGSCLLPGHYHQKFVWCVGEGSNGKKIVADTMTGVLGRGNVSHLGIQHFGKRFQLGTTIGKLLNLVSDSEEIEKAAEGVLKSFVAGDDLHVDRKFKSPIDGHAATAKLMVFANVLPFFRDKTRGMKRRLVVAPVDAVVAEENKDPFLSEKMRAEYPGILNKLLAGARGLVERGQFVIPDRYLEANRQYWSSVNSAFLFFGESLMVEPDGFVPGIRYLFDQYVEWAERAKYSCFNRGNFRKEFNRYFAKELRARTIEYGKKYMSEYGQHVRRSGWKGLRFTSELDEAETDWDNEVIAPVKECEHDLQRVYMSSREANAAPDPEGHWFKESCKKCGRFFGYGERSKEVGPGLPGVTPF